MGFSVAASIRGFIAPCHQLSANAFVWRSVLAELRTRCDGRREAGAFLLGRHVEMRRRILEAVFYDDLDPDCLRNGAIDFDGRKLAALFALCKQKGLEVVADVHVHPRGSGQSDVDHDNAMIRQMGHIALIVPRFARNGDADLGIYQYHGGGEWTKQPQSSFYRGIW